MTVPSKPGCRACVGTGSVPRARGTGDLPTAGLSYQQANPKRPGSLSWFRYEKYKSATTVQDALSKGMKRADLKFDFERGFVVGDGTSSSSLKKPIASSPIKKKKQQKEKSQAGALSKQPKKLSAKKTDTEAASKKSKQSSAKKTDTETASKKSRQSSAKKNDGEAEAEPSDSKKDSRKGKPKAVKPDKQKELKPATKSLKPTAQELIAQLEVESGGTLHFFGPLLIPDERMSMEELLALPHILLPLQVASTARKILNEIRKDVLFWEYDPTSLGNHIFNTHMMPLLVTVNSQIKRKKWQDAFSHLLGISLVDRESWLEHQEVYQEYDEFKKFFDDLSNAWTVLLQQSDKELGLNLQCTQKVKAVSLGYRAEVNTQLLAFQTKVNEMLANFDEFAPASPPSKPAKKAKNEGDRFARVRVSLSISNSARKNANKEEENGEREEQEAVVETEAEEAKEESAKLRAGKKRRAPTGAKQPSTKQSKNAKTQKKEGEEKANAESERESGARSGASSDKGKAKVISKNANKKKENKQQSVEQKAVKEAQEAKATIKKRRARAQSAQSTTDVKTRRTSGRGKRS